MSVGRSQRSRDTLAEMRMRRELRAQGLRNYRIHTQIPLPQWGKKRQWTTPDVVFTKERVAVFIDGCWFHGCPICVRESKTNTGAWRKKAAQARARDERHSRALVVCGWRVLRFWEHDDPAAAAKAVKAVIETEVDPGVYGLPT